MIYLRREILLKAFKLFDLAAMTCIFLLAAALDTYETSPIPFRQILSLRISIQNVLLFSGFLFLWGAIFSSLKLYHSRRLSPQREEILNVLKGTTLATLIVVMAALVFRIKIVTPNFVLIFWILGTCMVICSRLLLRFIQGRIRLQGRNLRYMLIIGTNPRAVQFARNIESKPELGYQVSGFVDERWPGIGEFQKTGYTLRADLDTFAALIRESVVDEVVMALPMKSFYEQQARIVSACQEQGIVVRCVSDIFNINNGHSQAEEFEGGPVITFSKGDRRGGGVFAKRALDIFVSSVILIFLSLIFLVVTLLIKLTSRGPVLFVQERVGLGKRRFRLYKFRTMIQGAEKKLAELEHLNEMSGPVFKIKNDPRITKIGKFLRETSIDELPQLINVLKGDMSLVGPRPLPVRDYDGFDQDWQRRRFSVCPGITCLWQVNGRSNVSFDKWMKLDMEYIDNWSLTLDFKILIMTIPAVLRGSGAA